MDFNREITSLPPQYKPSADEPYMSPLHREFFRRRLMEWREEILSGAMGTLNHLQTETRHEPDSFDRATRETDCAVELRTRDRERKLLGKIDKALVRVMNGEYGYCEETGEPIGLSRLDARPTATLSLEAQERHEKLERIRRDD